MKKVAIVTLNGYFNHGNRLQNYALQEAISSMGFEVETLVISTHSDNRGSSKEKSKVQVSSLLNRDFVKSLRIAFWKLRNKRSLSVLNKQRTSIFKKFTIDFINESKIVISDNNVDMVYCSQFDYFVAGSDQVWNPEYFQGSSLYFLTFAQPQRRIAYAPSFGVSKIPLELVNNYRVWLGEIEHISVREKDGARLVKELTGKDVPVVVDPTMLLSASDWMKVVIEPSIKQPYVCTYFLGEVSSEYRTAINYFASVKNCKVINLADIKDQNYVSGPSQFIGLIRNAELFCTDSFHGTVFSILFHTPFIVFRRSSSHSASMFSRLETLLETFGFQNREFMKLEDNDVFYMDFSYVDAVLAVEKRRAFDFLAKSFGIEETM